MPAAHLSCLLLFRLAPDSENVMICICCSAARARNFRRPNSNASDDHRLSFIKKYSPPEQSCSVIILKISGNHFRDAARLKRDFFCPVFGQS